MSLTETLGRSKHVQDVLQECARGLSSIREDLRQEVADRGPRPRVVGALEESQRIEDGMREASAELSVVNWALAREARERALVDYQFAAAIEQEEAARLAASHDVLTGLPNRVLFNERVQHGFEQARLHGWIMAVLFIDLDGFKAINDAYGHETGDVVLQIISRRLEKRARLEDTVSRHGGDEFVYLAADTRNPENIVALAKRLIHTIRMPCAVDVRDLHISPTISASVGISVFPKDGTTANALIESADRAMYQAKKEQCGYAFADGRADHTREVPKCSTTS